MNKLRRHTSVTMRLLITFSVVAITSLTAVIFTVSSLSDQRDQILALASTDFRAITLAASMQDSIDAEAVLRGQYAILHDEDLRVLADRRRNDSHATWTMLAPLLDERSRETVGEAWANFQQSYPTTPTVVAHISESPMKARHTLARSLQRYRSDAGPRLARSMQGLATSAQKAFQWSVLLLVGGLLIGIPVVWSCIAGIHKSVQQLRGSIIAIGDGRSNENLEPHIDRDFEGLSSALGRMGRRLKDMAQARLDANPLTGLPGNRAIQHELNRRLDAGEVVAHGYIDVDHFKAYNDRYGYQCGDDVLARIGEIIVKATQENCPNGGWAGHIGGDDFVVLSERENAEDVATAIAKEFEQIKGSFYTEEDRERGHFYHEDRFGVQRKFPLMSLSIAFVCSDNVYPATPATIATACTRVKAHLKTLPGSNHLIDRRSVA